MVYLWWIQNRWNTRLTCESSQILQNASRTIRRYWRKRHQKTARNQSIPSIHGRNPQRTLRWRTPGIIKRTVHVRHNISQVHPHALQRILLHPLRWLHRTLDAVHAQRWTHVIFIPRHVLGIIRGQNTRFNSDWHDPVEPDRPPRILLGKNSSQ